MTASHPNTHSTLENSDEVLAVYSFLKGCGISNPTLTLLPRDASKRYYYRVNGAKLLVMVADETQKPEQFKRISHILLNIGLHAPRVHAEYENFYLIDDFGTGTYRKTLTDENRKELYEQATDVLIHIATTLTSPLEGISHYTADVILNELMLFLEWHVDLSSTESTPSFTKIWQDYLSQIEGPQTLILRDYHIDNLFYFPQEEGLKKVGLIDFQDGVFGPASLDLVSLTEDARTDVPENLRTSVTKRFMEAFPSAQHASMTRTAKIIDLARQLRILGVFSRLAKRDGRLHYLDHAPHLNNYVKQHLKDPFFKEFAHWCRSHDLFQD